MDIRDQPIPPLSIEIVELLHLEPGCYIIKASSWGQISQPLKSTLLFDNLLGIIIRL